MPGVLEIESSLLNQKSFDSRCRMPAVENRIPSIKPEVVSFEMPDRQNHSL